MRCFAVRDVATQRAIGLFLLDPHEEDPADEIAMLAQRVAILVFNEAVPAGDFEYAEWFANALELLPKEPARFKTGHGDVLWEMSAGPWWLFDEKVTWHSLPRGEVPEDQRKYKYVVRVAGGMVETPPPKPALRVVSEARPQKGRRKQ